MKDNSGIYTHIALPYSIGDTGKQYNHMVENILATNDFNDGVAQVEQIIRDVSVNDETVNDKIDTIIIR